MRIKTFLALLPSLFLTNCNTGWEVPPPGGTADVSHPVFVGGTWLSGYRNGALSKESQLTSVASYIHQSISYSWNSSDHDPDERIAPYLESGSLGINPKPWEADFQTASALGQRTDCKGEQSLGPVKTGMTYADVSAAGYLTPVTGSWRDYSVPKATTLDLLSPSLGLPWSVSQPNPFYHRFASAPGISTLAGDVAAADPTFSVVWTGGEEIFSYAQRGATGSPIPTASVFRAHLDSLLGILTANGSKGVLLNIPPLEVFPYFTTIPWNGASLDAQLADSLNGLYDLFAPHIHFEEGQNGFVVADPDFPFDIRQIGEGEFLCLTLPLDSVKCQYMGLLGATIPDQYELVASEILEINAAIAAYNSEIADAAAAHDFALADIHSYMSGLSGSGFVVDGVTFSSTFVSGNFFSLDGITFTGKGSVLIANEVIQTINHYFGANLRHKNSIYSAPGINFP